MAECASSPNPIISKDILRKKTNEESRLKGEYKVECEKWIAKRTYRKASADREPTQDVNTLGGQRPRADLIQVPAAKFRTWSQRGVSTDGGSYGCVRKVFQHLLFYKNGFEHQQKVKPNRTKTMFLKKFDIRREPKGSQREPKGSQREPKGSQRSRK